MDYENERRKLRLYSKAEIGKPENCWLWKGYIFSLKHKELPYGQFWWGEINGKDKTISAHRASWIIANGKISGGLQVLHRCNNSLCINPNHLYLGTHENNMRDRDKTGRTSRGAHRYNFVRHGNIIEQAMKMRKDGMKIQAIADKLKIGRTTVYRCLGLKC